MGSPAQPSQKLARKSARGRCLLSVVVVLQASLLARADDDSAAVQPPADAKDVQRCVGWHQLGWLLGIYTFDDGATTCDDRIDFAEPNRTPLCTYALSADKLDSAATVKRAAQRASWQL